MMPKQVWLMHLAHKEWTDQTKTGYNNFCRNLRTLRAAIDRDRDRMLKDVQSYGPDRAIVNAMRASDPNYKTPWYKSDAFKLLKQDVQDEVQKKMKPKQLHASRDEYSAFDLNEFRPHIYQITNAEPKQATR